MNFSPAPSFVAPEATPPKVVLWARLYAAAFALMYLACVVGGIGILAAAPDLWSMHKDDLPPGVYAILFIVIGIPLMGLSVAAAVMKPSKLTWTLMVVIQGLGATSCCCMPASIPLLIYWLKPETKRWYGA